MPSNKDKKKSRIWVFSAISISTPAAQYTHPMPSDIDNSLPDIEM